MIYDSDGTFTNYFLFLSIWYCWKAYWWMQNEACTHLIVSICDVGLVLQNISKLDQISFKHLRIKNLLSETVSLNGLALGLGPKGNRPGPKLSLQKLGWLELGKVSFGNVNINLMYLGFSISSTTLIFIFWVLLYLSSLCKYQWVWESVMIFHTFPLVIGTFC